MGELGALKRIPFGLDRLAGLRVLRLNDRSVADLSPVLPDRPELAIHFRDTGQLPSKLQEIAKISDDIRRMNAVRDFYAPIAEEEEKKKEEVAEVGNDQPIGIDAFFNHRFRSMRSQILITISRSSNFY